MKATLLTARNIPPAMSKALATAPKARAAFNRFPPSHQKEYVKWISEAKKPATAHRRFEKMIPMLLAKAS